MRPAEIVSVGGISIDVIVQSPQLPTAGQCVVAAAMHHGLGGKAANQAVAASRLGGAVTLVGAVGNDGHGELALAQLSAEGVAIDRIHRDDSPTASVVIQLDASGRKQAAVVPGANGRMTRERVDAAAGVIANARVVVVQLEIPMEAVRRTIEIARNAGAQVILDPSPARPVPPELLRQATVVKPNASEARTLTGIEVHDADSARAAAARLLDLGVQLVAVEAGRTGNLFVTREDEVLVPLYDVLSVDRTGAGDAMVGAIAIALIDGWSLQHTAEFASAAAALTTRSLGAQPAMPRREEIRHLLAMSSH